MNPIVSITVLDNSRANNKTTTLQWVLVALFVLFTALFVATYFLSVHTFVVVALMAAAAISVWLLSVVGKKKSPHTKRCTKYKLGDVIHLKNGKLTLGNNHDADVCIDHGNVSGRSRVRHCSIKIMDSGMVVLDEASARGTDLTRGAGLGAEKFQNTLVELKDGYVIALPSSKCLTSEAAYGFVCRVNIDDGGDTKSGEKTSGKASTRKPLDSNDTHVDQQKDFETKA